ncbi:hypothetical protein MUP29_02495 [bacterium]|nr:hypothetical protein [bacterium]
MSVAQDECVLFTKIWNPDPYSDSSAATPGRGVAAESVANFFGSGGDSMGTAPSDEETAAELDNFYFIKGYVVLEKGDYQVMYLQDLNFLRNINNNNSVEIIVRLPGINKISPGPDDWTKGKKSRITLRPGEMAEFDDGSGATLIKVRCP